MRQVSVTLSTDTSAYANADLIADNQTITDAFGGVIDGWAYIRAIQVLDGDDQTLFTYRLIFHQTTTSMGTENSAPSMSDANLSASVLGHVLFATADGFDFGGAKMYYKSDLWVPIKPIAGTSNLGIAMLCDTGTPTFTAAGVIVKLWITP